MFTVVLLVITSFILCYGISLLLMAQREKQVSKLKADKYLVLTGCDSGIGEAVLKSLLSVKSRFTVVGVFKERDNAETAAKLFEGSRFVPKICDISCPTQIKSLAHQILTERGTSGLFGLVNVAGVIIAGDAILMGTPDYRKVFEVNFFGTVELTQLLLPHLIKNRGMVLFTTSVLSQLLLPGLSAYSSSKLALEGYIDCLRRETSLLGLHVVTIRPPQTKTKLLPNMWNSYQQMFDKAPKEIQSILGQKYIDRIVNGSMRRVTDASAISVEKVADTICRVIMTSNPSPVHWIGLFGKAIALPLSLLPVWLVDLCLVRGNHIIFGIRAGPDYQPELQPVSPPLSKEGHKEESRKKKK